MTIVVNETPTVDAGNNTSVCIGNTVNLNGVIGGSATSAIWSASSGTFSDASNLTSTYTPSITSGSITLTLSTNGPCPTVTDQVTISIITQTLPAFNSQGPYCSGDPFTLPSQSINGVFGTWSPAINNSASTTYTFTPNSGQCASSTTLLITINPIVTPTFTQITPICSGGSISLPTTSLNGITGTWAPAINNTATTLYTFTPTAGQCASTATMTVTVNSLTLPTFNQVASICSGGSFVLPSTSSNGISGTWSPAINNTVTTNYTFIPTAGQCATNTTMTIAVNSIFSTNTTQTVCPSQIPYIWNGVTFNGPATQTAALASINNCDSLVTMTLNVSTTITSNTSLSICPSDLPYSWNGLTFNSAGSQSVNLTATSGCDSVATLNLAVFNPQSSSVNQTVCSTQIPYVWNGLTFNGSGTQTATLQDVNGCDSLASLTLQVSNTLTSSSALSVCPSELPYSWNGLTFSNAGTQTATLQSAGGCDSLATLTLNLNPTYNETETISICSNETPYLWNGLSFSSTSNPTITLNSINGCDSIVTLNLTVLPVFSASLDSTICQNELPFVWNGLTFNSAGTQTMNLTSVNGCDSSIIMNVQVLALPQISISGGGIFCEGDVIQPVEVNVVGSSPFNVSYTLDGVGINISSNQTIISLGNIAGDYVLTEISDQNCLVNSNLSSASIIINPIPSAPQVSNDSIYCLNSTPDSLIASGNLNSSITWFIDPALSNPIQTGNSYYPDINLGQTTYYVVQENNGCVSAPNEVMITFEICDIIVPTAFTPDGDNTNDFWNLGNIDALYPNNLVTVYNRWGNLIYQSQPGKYQSKPWDGTHNQEPMPVGSYYFIIEFGVSFKGNESGIVTIVK
jgi:gliding motility-associated-like protein